MNSTAKRCIAATTRATARTAVTAATASAVTAAKCTTAACWKRTVTWLEADSPGVSRFRPDVLQETRADDRLPMHRSNDHLRPDRQRPGPHRAQCPAAVSAVQLALGRAVGRVAA